MTNDPPPAPDNDDRSVDSPPEAVPSLPEDAEVAHPPGPIIDGEASMAAETAEHELALAEAAEAADDEEEIAADIPTTTRIEARIELFQSHSLTALAALLQSFNEGFAHTAFAAGANETISDEYANERFRVAYCLGEGRRDQICVSWVDEDAAGAHGDDELLALARQIAYMLGGGTNLRLVDCVVAVK